MQIIQNRYIQKAVSWLANLTTETLVIFAGAAVIAGLWYLGFVLKVF